MRSPLHFTFLFSTLVALCFGLLGQLRAEIVLGDLDADGLSTIRDLARLQAHANDILPLTVPEVVAKADLNQDGVLNNLDVELLMRQALGLEGTRVLPLLHVRTTQPVAGSADVSLTRETVLHFSLPLHESTVLDTSALWAEFGGKKILSRVELAPTRTKATLFYLEPLPANARIHVYLQAPDLQDIVGRAVDFDADGVAGGAFTMSFDTLGAVAVTNTAVRGRVLASERAMGGAETPLAGVTVTVDGAEETLRTVTNAAGEFVLSPCPAGRFFVHIDGRTAPSSNFPLGAYYPTVGKAWDAVAGREDTLCGAVDDTTRGIIYLPLIKAGALQPVSATVASNVTSTDIPGAVLTVPANALHSDDGTRGGRVGMAPVAPDRLPSPLPPGLNLPLVITIQTDGGTNFDQPAPLCLPNTPDPATGQPKAPGTKVALWSFNHDSGRWEVVGPMTVSADGLTIKTDPGVGIRQPGWHGAASGTQGEGADPQEPPDKDCYSDEQVIYVVLDFAKEIASCAADVAGITQALNLLKTALTTMYDLTRKIQALDAAMAAAEAAGGGLTLAEVQAAISILKLGKEYLIAVLANFAAQDPLGKAEKVFNCLGNLLSIAQSVCGLFNSVPEDAPADCQPSYLTKKICKGIDAAKVIHDYVKSVIKLFKEAKGKIATAFLCFSIDKLETLLNTYVLASSRSSSGRHLSRSTNRPLTLTELAALRKALGEVESDFSESAEVLANADGLIDGYDQTMDSIVDLGEMCAQAAAAEGVAITGTGYYLLTSGSLTVRGSLTSAGITAILPPSTYTTIKAWHPERGFADTAFITDGEGSRTTMPPLWFDYSGETSADTDGDSLPDTAETIIGTDLNDADTDNDGVSDYAEAVAGTDPLGGVPASPGIIAAAPITGDAQDVAAGDGVLAVAAGTGGVTFFDISAGRTPVRTTQISTAGSARAVAVDGQLAAAAISEAGVAIFDLSQPTAPFLWKTVNIDAVANSIVAEGGVAWVGTETGTVVVIDLATGLLLGEADVTSLYSGFGTVHDLGFLGDRLIVLGSNRVALYSLNGTTPTTGSIKTLAGGIPGRVGQRRLAVGSDFFWVTQTFGWEVFANDATAGLQSLGETAFANPDFYQPALTSAGFAVGGTASVTTTTSHGVSLFESIASDGTGGSTLTTYSMTSRPRGTALYDGLAYIAGGTGGLNVVLYQLPDTGGLAPMITLGGSLTLNHSAHTGTAQEGAIVQLAATVDDDVEVGRVEFWIDGQRVRIDGSYPFEIRTLTPRLADRAVPSFTVKAVAYDTGGNEAETEEYTITLTADTTAPLVTRFSVEDGSLLASLTEVDVVFSEVIDETTLSGTSLDGTAVIHLLSEGADRVFGTADDVVISPNRDYSAESKNLRLTFGTGLAPGAYVLTVAPPIADLAGNVLGEPSYVYFRIISDLDTDGDGLPDDYEIEYLGTDPNDTDSDNDGLADSSEDSDRDGLSNLYEITFGLNPILRDSDHDRIADGDEDNDSDGLRNSLEISYGSNPLKADTDGDGWMDGDEIEIPGAITDPAKRPVKSATERVDGHRVVNIGSDASIATAGQNLVQAIIPAADGPMATARQPVIQAVNAAQDAPPRGLPARQPIPTVKHTIPTP